MEKLYLGIKGSIVCIDKINGAELWRTELNKTGHFNFLIDEKNIIAYSHGNIYMLETTTGKVLWKNELKGLGYGYCTIATEGRTAYAQSSLQQSAAVGSVVNSLI